MGTMVFHSQLYHHHNFKVNTIQHIKLWFKLAIRRFLSVHRSCTIRGCDALPRVEMDRPTKMGGKQGILPQGPQSSFENRGSTSLLIFFFFRAASSRYFFFFCSPLHCLDSMSECLGRIISNTFSKG